MCQARVVMIKDGREEELMREVISLEVTEEGLLLKTFFDEPRLIKGRISRIDFLKHVVFIDPGEET